jgi:hypothetical protein
MEMSLFLLHSKGLFVSCMRDTGKYVPEACHSKTLQKQRESLQQSED